jgi:hypothetical protein
VTGRRRSPDNETDWSVEFEIASPLRVTNTEVQMLETWLGRQLDALFEGHHSSQGDIAVPDDVKYPLIRERG